jgi:hypothetical protein
MKKIKFRVLIIAIIIATNTFYSCKSKKENDASSSTTMDTTTVTAPTPAPAEISSDDVLKRGVTDAVKDYPGVKADVSDSVINLSGEIKRADWQKLNPTLNSLHPKRINSANLTIK